MNTKMFLGAVSIVALTLTSSTVAHALGNISDKKFSNCAALNRVYPGGVASSNSSKNKGGATKYSPSVSAKVYKENKAKDRDHDGIACER